MVFSLNCVRGKAENTIDSVKTRLPEVSLTIIKTLTEVAIDHIFNVEICCGDRNFPLKVF